MKKVFECEGHLPVSVVALPYCPGRVPRTCELLKSLSEESVVLPVYVRNSEYLESLELENSVAAALADRMLKYQEYVDAVHWRRTNLDSPVLGPVVSVDCLTDAAWGTTIKKVEGSSQREAFDEARIEAQGSCCNFLILSPGLARPVILGEYFWLRGKAHSVKTFYDLELLTCL